MAKSPITKEMLRRVERQRRTYRLRRMHLENTFPEIVFEVYGSRNGKDVWLCSRKRDMAPVGLVVWEGPVNGYGFAPISLTVSYLPKFLRDILLFLEYAEKVSE